ncbi:MAG: hypothetical protein JOY85_07035 [Acidobacteriaceae bacterium]|nr:hypothetical protein [Acidobacteriaceae bacterium]
MKPFDNSNFRIVDQLDRTRYQHSSVIETDVLRQADLDRPAQSHERHWQGGLAYHMDDFALPSTAIQHLGLHQGFAERGSFDKSHQRLILLFDPSS